MKRSRLQGSGLLVPAEQIARLPASLSLPLNPPPPPPHPSLSFSLFLALSWQGWVRHKRGKKVAKNSSKQSGIRRIRVGNRPVRKYLF